MMMGFMFGALAGFFINAKVAYYYSPAGIALDMAFFGLIGSIIGGIVLWVL